MKKIIFLIYLLYILSPVIFAETITTGSSSVNTSITTNANDGQVQTSVNVQSSGDSEVHVQNKVESSSTSTTTSNTYKKIEVNVNGEKKIVESREPGEIRIDITSAPLSKTPTPTPTKTASPSATPTPKDATDSASTDPLGEHITAWVKDFIKDLFEKIF